MTQKSVLTGNYGGPVHSLYLLAGLSPMCPNS